MRKTDIVKAFMSEDRVLDLDAAAEDLVETIRKLQRAEGNDLVKLKWEAQRKQQAYLDAVRAKEEGLYERTQQEKAASVAEVIAVLSQWPAGAKVWAEWEGVRVPLEASRIRFERNMVVLDVDDT